MQGIIAICNWINRALTTALEWVISLPGLIVTFIGTLVGTVTFVVSYLQSISNGGSLLVNGTQAAVNSVQSLSFFGSPIWSLFSWMGALDVLYEYLSFLGGIFLGYVGLCFATLLGGVIVLFAMVLSTNILQKLVRLVSAGFLNV